MARPQPTHICSHQENDWNIEVCEADAVYAVLYRGRPIKLRKIKNDCNYIGPKYMKSMFPEPGHAVRLANRLNRAHGTDAFTVGIMEVKREFL